MEPLYSIVVPAYNEQHLLARSLPAIRAAMDALGAAGELIVVDNNSTDRTAEVAREHGAAVVFEPVNQISRARNAGARLARGRYLVFVDADTMLPPELLRAAIASLQDGRACGGGALVAFDRRPPWQARWVAAAWNAAATRAKLAAGCFLFCLREAFDAAGGFSQKVYASEEVWLSRRLRRWGRQRGLDFEILRAPPVVTSARRTGSWRDLLAFLFLVAFPLGLRSRRLTAMWYRKR